MTECVDFAVFLFIWSTAHTHTTEKWKKIANLTMGNMKKKMGKRMQVWNKKFVFSSTFYAEAEAWAGVDRVWYSFIKFNYY